MINDIDLSMMCQVSRRLLILVLLLYHRVVLTFYLFTVVGTGRYYSIGVHTSVIYDD